jgi:iron complex transport system ATP-binding protein
MRCAVHVRAASFSYAEHEVFRNVDLEVFPGEVLCLLGANGCGKTTLLRCINGTLKVNSGSIRLGDRSLWSMTATEIARKVGIVFQEHNAPFPYPVLDVVTMGRAPHLKIFGAPGTADIEIAEEALESVGMHHLRNDPYTKISGGERQLVLIARTIAQQPDIILLDEPTSHLDLKNQALVLSMVNRLAARGMTVMMSSHLPNHALQYCSKAALMYGGGLSAVGRPGDVISEDSLRRVYGIDVKIYTGRDRENSREVQFCMPSLESGDRPSRLG